MYLVTQIQNKLPGRKVHKSENIHPKERNKKKYVCLETINYDVCPIFFSGFPVSVSTFRYFIVLFFEDKKSTNRNSRIRLPQVSTKTQYLLNYTICIDRIIYIKYVSNEEALSR